MDNQQPSSSSVKQPEMDKIEDGQAEKKLKEESKSNYCEDQLEMESKCFIDELPPEMLMEIFKYLNVKSLKNTRIVSRKWNGIARKIIQTRKFENLKKLRLDVSRINKTEPNQLSTAAAFVSHHFESNKDTLRRLKVGPLGFLLDLQLPKFSKLTWLGICEERKEEIPVQVFPSGLDFNETFPLLQHLDLDFPWPSVFPHNEILSLPYVKILRITGREMTEDDVARISQMCPKLKDFRVTPLNCGGELENFPEVGKAIWTHLTKLESLELLINADDPTACPAIDSCFTGFSGEDCTRLYELIKKEKIVKKQESRIKSDSKIQLDAERKNPSILDLKDLRKLTVALRSGTRKDKTNLDLSSKILTVGEKYAFKLMENLQYEIEKKYF